jgi:hypothetical protein
MSTRRGLAWLALLVLPACLDPIVGTECANGYSPCHGVCVAAGTCGTPDDASETASEVGAAVDGAVEAEGVDAGAPLDSASSEPGEDAEPIVDGQAIDLEPPDTGLSADLPAQDDVSAQDDAPTQDDVPLTDDSGPPPILVVDATADQGEPIDEGALEGGPCVDCLDAEGIGEGGNVDGGGESAADADNSIPVDGALVCPDTQVVCNDQCVDTSLDPENCGDCNNICASGVCIDSGCLVCAAEESVCGRQCVNLATNPDNCGGCGNPCASGLCSNGRCEAAGTGRAIIIGHDYLKNRPAMNRILGNAVFLWPVNPVRLLVYEGQANAAAITGADAAIAQVASATGRQLVRTAAAAADVPTLLASTDVFLIYGQELADDATLVQLSSDWSAALSVFMNAGGTVVLLDAAYAGNSGTCQILAQPILFAVTRAVSATGDVCTVVARGDALATGLPRTYLCEQNSTSFAVADLSNNITTVVQDGDKTVVVHKLF